MIKPKRRWAWTHKNTRKSRSVKYLSNVIDRYLRSSNGHFTIPKATRSYQKKQNRSYVRCKLSNITLNISDDFVLDNNRFLKDIGVWDDPFW